MSEPTRRAVLIGTGWTVMANALWAAWPATAQTQFVRQSIAIFSQDAATVTAFRAGVRVMKSRGSSNPTSWGYQANIHGIPSGTTLRPQWATCNHGTWFFLPWHRMYLYWFERILRNASRDPNFALPYWNYKDATQRKLPLIFRSPANSTNPLYEVNRRSSINAGTSGLSSADVDDRGAFAQNSFALTSSPYGFGGYPHTRPRHFGSNDGELEWSPHNNVHSTIGGYMGDLNRSARDAIFFLHHANIDRLWSEWLSLGHRNPVRTDYRGSYWLDQQFTFFNEQGVAVTESVSEFMATRGVEYRYDTETAPRSPSVETPSGGMTGPATLATTVLAQTKQPVRLGARPISVPIAPKTSLRPPAGPGGRLFVRIVNIRAKSPPGSNFDVYLNLPAGTKADPDQKLFFVGRLSFFGRSAAERTHSMNTDTGGDRSFDISGLAERQTAAGVWQDLPTVTIVPAFPEDVNLAAEPSIESVAIVSR